MVKSPLNHHCVLEPMCPEAALLRLEVLARAPLSKQCCVAVVVTTGSWVWLNGEVWHPTVKL